MAQELSIQGRGIHPYFIPPSKGVLPFASRLFDPPSLVGRVEPCKPSSLAKIHELPPLETRGGTGIVANVAYAMSDTQAEARFITHVGQCMGATPNVQADSASTFNRANLIASGIDNGIRSHDGLKRAKRVGDQFEIAYNKMNIASATVETSAGVLSLPERFAILLGRTNSVVSTTTLASLGGFFGLFCFFVARFGIYAKTEWDFKNEFPSSAPLHEQMAFLYDKILLTEDEKRLVMYAALHKSDGGLLTEEELAIVLPHEKEEITKRIKEKQAYRSFGFKLAPEEEDGLIALVISETAKVKHQKEAAFERTVGKNSLVSCKQLIAFDFTTQQVERENKAAWIEKGMTSFNEGVIALDCGVGQIEKVRRNDPAATQQAILITNEVKSENLKNLCLNTFVTLICILGAIGVGIIMSYGIFMASVMLWLVIDFIMLVFDTGILVRAIGSNAPGKKERVAIAFVTLFSIATAVLTFFFASTIIYGIALGMQLLLAICLMYQYIIEPWIKQLKTSAST